MHNASQPRSTLHMRESSECLGAYRCACCSVMLCKVLTMNFHTQRETPSEADAALRADVLARLGQLVARNVLGFEGLSVRPYGSFVSGLYSPEGDLDVALDGFLDYRCDGCSTIASCDSYAVESHGKLLSAQTQYWRIVDESKSLCKCRHASQQVFACATRRDGQPPVPICKSSTQMRADMLRVSAFSLTLEAYRRQHALRGTWHYQHNSCQIQQKTCHR